MSFKGLKPRIFHWMLVLLLTVVLAWRVQQLPAGCQQVSAIPEDHWLAVDGTPAGESQPEKLVCLTFDDGPSRTTEDILDTLAREQVPATFFVMAADNNRQYLPIIAREVEEGHEIALHSASHEYAQIYASDKAYWSDIKQLRKAICHYVDVDDIHWLRFPGGSTNTVSHKYGGSDLMQTLKRQAAEKGYRYLDWNVCAEDAAGGRPSPDEIYNNVVNDVGEKTVCVVLMHDTAATGNTAKALGRIIRWFREEGFTFCTVSRMGECTK